MTQLAFVYSYYENPAMLSKQQRVWAEYSEEHQRQIEIIVTDDCSEQMPIAVDHFAPHVFDMNLTVSLFRITKKVPWNWLEARNIGAKHAESEWLLLTDMDHVVTKKTLSRILKRLPRLNKNWVYQFDRVLAPDNAPYHFHNDSFLVTKKLFWKCGGYDEDYAGHYGTSGMFRRRLFSYSDGQKKLSDVALTLYQRSVIPDASTTSLPRKEGRDPSAIKKVTEWKLENNRKIQHFLQPYERLL